MDDLSRFVYRAETYRLGRKWGWRVWVLTDKRNQKWDVHFHGTERRREDAERAAIDALPRLVGGSG